VATRTFEPTFGSTFGSMAGALGDPTRRAIFERLTDGPRAVGHLAHEFPVSRPAVSQHLKVLKDAGLVVDRQIGRQRLYQVDPAGVGAMRMYFDRFWTKALANFAAPAGTSKPPTPRSATGDGW
jgi:DNA-binding transcriptional ArsR family regulator